MGNDFGEGTVSDGGAGPRAFSAVHFNPIRTEGGSMETLFIDGETVRRVLPVADCIEVMAETFADLVEGRIGQPLRSVIRLVSGRGLLGLMPADGSHRGVAGIKALSVFPGNATIGLPSHQGVVLLFEAEHGRLLAVVDAESITAVRTPAASAVATRALAFESACTLALLGTGVQAEGHLESMRAVRPVREVRVWDIDRVRAAEFARVESARCGLPVEMAETVEEAVAGAQIICTLTPSKEPILRSEWVEDGAHINAVGACTPDAREVDSALVARARVYTDSRESLLAEAGDFLIPLAEGAIGRDHLRGELGDVLTGRVEGRQRDDEITLFESLGVGAQDLAAAEHVYRRCRELGLGVALS